MKPHQVKGPYLVYLLHFHAVQVSHYAGITTPQRLDARMREHAAGRGAGATAAACQAGLSWSLAATFITNNRVIEKKIGSLRDLPGACPVCRGQPPLATFRPTKMAASGNWRPRSFRELPALGPTQARATPETEKGELRRQAPPFLSFGQS